MTTTRIWYTNIFGLRLAYWRRSRRVRSTFNGEVW